MKTIYKYTFDIKDQFYLNIPVKAKILKVDMQYTVPTLWAEIDTEEPCFDEQFFMRGTGQPIPVDSFHVGTFYQSHFVWHLFQKLPFQNLPTILRVTF